MVRSGELTVANMHAKTGFFIALVFAGPEPKLNGEVHVSRLLHLFPMLFTRL